MNSFVYTALQLLVVSIAIFGDDFRHLIGS